MISKMNQTCSIGMNFITFIIYLIKIIYFNYRSENVWSSIVNIPADTDVRYRYFVCVPVGNQIIVRRWESGMKPRCIEAEGK